MAARMIALAVALASCGAPRFPHRAPPLPDILESAVRAEATAYEESALFPDERALLADTACRLDVTPAGGSLVTDEQARTACDALAAHRDVDSANACRRACLVGARVAIAPLLQREMFAGVRDFRGTLADPDHEICRQLVDHSPNQITEAQARELWRCLGMAPLPARASLLIQFRTHEIHDGNTTSVAHDRHVTVVVATSSMIPGAALRQFVLADSSECAPRFDGVCVATEQPQ